MPLYGDAFTGPDRQGPGTMDGAVEACSERVCDHVRRSLAGIGNILMEIRRNTVSEIDPDLASEFRIILARGTSQRRRWFRLTCSIFLAEDSMGATRTRSSRCGRIRWNRNGIRRHRCIGRSPCSPDSPSSHDVRGWPRPGRGRRWPKLPRVLVFRRG